MNLRKIIRTVRFGLHDVKGADSIRLWKDEELAGFADLAQREIIKELLCLTSDDDVAETLATGTITLSGAAGQVSSVSVNGLDVTAVATPFNSTLSQTATDLATNINAFATDSANTNPIKFTAQAVGAIVTISAPSGTGSTPNGYSVASTVSGGMSYISTRMSGGACLCRMFIIPGQARYQMHPKTILITSFYSESQLQNIDPVTKQKLDQTYPGWKSCSAGDPYAYIPDYQNKTITLFPTPLLADTIDLDLVRQPYEDFAVETEADWLVEPEINEDYHDAMVPWIKHLAFMKNDVEETLDLPRAAVFEKEFHRMIEQIKTRMQNFQEPKSTGISDYAMY